KVFSRAHHTLGPADSRNVFIVRPRSLALVVLRVAAPSIPTVRVRVAGLQTDEQPVGRARVEVADGERGLKSHRLIERIDELRRAVLLTDCDQMTEQTGEIHICRAERGRREDLRLFGEIAPRNLRTPSKAAVRQVDRVEITTLRVEHAPVPVSRARALISPTTCDRVDAHMFVGLRELRGRRRVGETDRTIER